MTRGVGGAWYRKRSWEGPRRRENVWTESSRAQHQSRLPPFLPVAKLFFTPPHLAAAHATLTRAFSDSAGVLVDASCADTTRQLPLQKARPDESKRRCDITMPPRSPASPPSPTNPPSSRAEGWRAQCADLGASDGCRYEATMDGIPDERLDAGGSRCSRDGKSPGGKIGAGGRSEKAQERKEPAAGFLGDEQVLLSLLKGPA